MRRAGLKRAWPAVEAEAVVGRGSSVLTTAASTTADAAAATEVRAVRAHTACARLLPAAAAQNATGTEPPAAITECVAVRGFEARNHGTAGRGEAECRVGIEKERVVEVVPSIVPWVPPEEREERWPVVGPAAPRATAVVRANVVRVASAAKPPKTITESVRVSGDDTVNGPAARALLAHVRAPVVGPAAVQPARRHGVHGAAPERVAAVLSGVAVHAVPAIKDLI